VSGQGCGVQGAFVLPGSLWKSVWVHGWPPRAAVGVAVRAAGLVRRGRRAARPEPPRAKKASKLIPRPKEGRAGRVGVWRHPLVLRPRWACVYCVLSRMAVSRRPAASQRSAVHFGLGRGFQSAGCAREACVLGLGLARPILVEFAYRHPDHRAAIVATPTRPGTPRLGFCRPLRGGAPITGYPVHHRLETKHAPAQSVIYRPRNPWVSPRTHDLFVWDVSRSRGVCVSIVPWTGPHTSIPKAGIEAITWSAVGGGAGRGLG